MPTLVRLGKLLIQVYSDDHNPPHFHAVTPDHEALVAFETLEIIRGSLRTRDLEAAREWAAGNPELLAAEWRRLNER